MQADIENAPFTRENRDEIREYLVDMLEQLSRLASACGEERIRKVLAELVNVSRHGRAGLH